MPFLLISCWFASLSCLGGTFGSKFLGLSQKFLEGPFRVTCRPEAAKIGPFAKNREDLHLALLPSIY